MGEVRPGESLVVRDLRTGDEIDVRERTFSRQARPGALICARAVPDGAGHQFVGGIFPVPPGRESALLDLLVSSPTSHPLLRGLSRRWLG